MSPISRVRLVVARTGALAAIAGGCWIASGAFPLAAPPTVVSDDAGVVVNIGDARLLQRTPVAYPYEALEQGVRGRVVVEAAIDADGGVREANVHCLRELCSAAADSIPAWRFDVRQANTTRTINIDFVLPPGVPASSSPDGSKVDETGLSLRRLLEQPRGAETMAQVLRPVAPGIMEATTVAQAPQFQGPVFSARTAWLDGAYVSLLPVTIQSAVGHALTAVRISGLSDTLASQLKSRLPVQAGDIWTAAAAGIVSHVVTGFDPPLEVDLINNPATQQWSLWIGPKATSGAKANYSPPLPPGVYATGAGVTPPALLLKIDPEYTDAARASGISGTVTLSVVAGADGTAQDIQVIGSLDPGLDQAAASALARWKFRPGTKDGAPVSVQTQVLVTFRVL
jgi:TonB family protein